MIGDHHGEQRVGKRHRRGIGADELSAGGLGRRVEVDSDHTRRTTPVVEATAGGAQVEHAVGWREVME
jgi:hypothetical protein